MKATNQELIDSYNSTGNIWKTAEVFKMCGQTVHERLIRLGVKLNNPKISEQDLLRIKEVYESGIIRGDNKLQLLSKELKRTIPFISRKAKLLGLTSYNRIYTDELKLNVGKRTSLWMKDHEHPRGFLNHKHSVETLVKLSEKSLENWGKMTDEKLADIKKKTYITSMKNGTYNRPRRKTTWKQQWATIGGKECYFRSQWEVNYAIFLEFLKNNKDIKDWEFEPETFWFESIKRGCRSYLPDFKVTENNDKIIFHEVKGWMDDRSKTKIKRMALYYPDVKLIIIREPEYKEILKKFSFLYK